MFKSLLSLALLTSFFTVSYNLPAQAQYDSARKEKRNSKSLFRRDFYMLSAFNTPSISESDFTLRFQSYGEVTGCADISKSKAELKETFGTITIEARDSELRTDKKQERYTNYDCDIKTHKSFFDVKLNRDDLIESNIKQLALISSRYGEFATSTLEVSEKKIDITTYTEGTSNLVTLWFYPKDTVILNLPGAKADVDARDALHAYAKTLGLTPIEDYFNTPGYDQKYETPEKFKHIAIFRDQQGVFINKVSDVQDSVVIGQVELMRDFYTAKGVTKQPYKLDVHLSIPGSPFLDAQ